MEQPSGKTDPLTAPYLAVDGALIRSVRENKKLTQLYVANVVGVTTDTISRWENNRYPSIKRENAEKLAGALEVELAEILRADEAGDSPEDEPVAPVVGRSRWLLPSGATALLLLFLAIYLFTGRPASAPVATRWVPRFAAPGEIVPVQIKVTRQKGEDFGFILKEKLPDALRMVSALPTASGAEAPGSGIKWLVPGGSASVTVSYTLQIPASPALHKEEKLKGEIVVAARGANRTETVGGNDSILIGAYHWADANGDGRIDDDEIMPAYYICEEMKGLGLDWKIIEAIWSGKGYRWDPQSGFTVIK